MSSIPIKNLYLRCESSIVFLGQGVVIVLIYETSILFGVFINKTHQTDKTYILYTYILMWIRIQIRFFFY